MKLKIENFLDKWSDEEKEAVREFAEVVSRNAARIALEEFKSMLDGAQVKSETMDSE